MPRSVAVLAALVLGPATTLGAQQTLRQQVQQLFTFSAHGPCGELICLYNLASFHGEHFNPSADTAGLDFVSFLQSSLALSVANTPVSSAAGGKTFRFEGGVPVATSTSGGPILGERAQTLGRGRWFVGFGVSQMTFQRLRGVPLDNIAFTFTHEDTKGTFPNGAPVPGQDTLGIPDFENDLINVQVSMNASLLVSSLSLSYGLVDGIDVGVTVPLVRASIEGTSVATILPADSAIRHFFDSTAAGKVLSARSAINASATGIGDMEAHLKINVAQGQRVGVALFGAARFPTGDAQNLLGEGYVSARGLGVVSARFGNFNPHANLGITVRDSPDLNNSVEANAGFDALVSTRTTMAVDLLSSWQVGTSKVDVPPPVVFQAPVQHTVELTNIPSQKDDFLSLALGFKFQTRGGLQFVTNALFPLRNAGLQPAVVWTGGLEYSF